MSPFVGDRSSKLQFVPALDGLRAVAALVVLLFHARFPGLKGGFIGVDVFFVLSGYLITTLIRNEYDGHGSFNYRRFLWRRTARLYPALLTMLAAFALVAPWLFPDAVVWREVLLSGSYVSDYARAFYRMPTFTQHTWSLAIEMQFYLFWPLVVTMLCRLDRPERVGYILIAAFLAVTAWRSMVRLEYNYLQSYYRLDTRASSLILGGALAFYVMPIVRRNAGIFGGVSLAALGVFAIVLRVPSIDYASWAGALVELCAAGVIIAAMTPGTTVSNILAWRPLTVMGLWSYSIYLWHYPIARLVRYQFDGAIPAMITFATAVPLAALTYYFVETRLYKSRRRVEPQTEPAG